MADIVTGLMLGATLINAAKNLWELTLKLDGDRKEERSYRYQGNLDLDKVPKLLLLDVRAMIDEAYCAADFSWRADDGFDLTFHLEGHCVDCDDVKRVCHSNDDFAVVFC